MKYLLTLVLALGLIGCGGGDATDDTGQTEESSSGAAVSEGSSAGGDVVVYVNGDAIYRKDVERLASTLKQRNIQPNPEVGGATMDEQYFNSAQRILENQDLVIQAAAEKGITATDEEVNAQLTQVQLQSGGITAFQAQLDAQGIAEDEVRRELFNQIVSRAYFTSLKDDIQVSPEEVQAFYDSSGLYDAQPQVRARHILKTVDPGADQAAKDAALEAIEGVKAKIEAGEITFEEAARTESQGPSAPNGGDLGYFNQGAMVPPFDQAAFSMEVGDVSDPVLTQFGYHLIKLEDKRTSPSKNFEDVRAEIELRLQNQMAQEAIQADVDRLRESAEFKQP